MYHLDSFYLLIACFGPPCEARGANSHYTQRECPCHRARRKEAVEIITTDLEGYDNDSDSDYELR